MGRVPRRHRYYGRLRLLVASPASLRFTAYLLVLYAFRLAVTAYVVAMRETSIVVATVLARVWLGESVSPTRALAVLGITVGATILALAA